jgi:hypothetical protein
LYFALRIKLSVSLCVFVHFSTALKIMKNRARNTWSVWINIESLNDIAVGRVLHVFNKGTLRESNLLTRSNL